MSTTDFYKKVNIISFEEIDKLDLSYSNFYELLILKKVKTKHKLDLTNTYIEELNLVSINFPIQNRETARIIKNSFEKQNNIIDGNKFYAFEMIEREKELEEDKKNGKNLFEWLVFKIHGITSNHSQDWTLALFWILIVGVINSLFNFYIVKDNEVFIHANFWSIFGTIFFLILIFFCNSFNKWIQLGFLYLLYAYKTNDIFLFYVVKVINPFQKMTDMNLIDFMSKVIIGYLIYQFVISIRQNTRRK